MNNENVNEYHGYLYLPRHSKLIIHELGYDLYGFYLGLVMCAVWYRGNKNFGRITKTQSEIAEALHMTQATVSRKFGELEKHKYFVIRHKKGIILGYFPLFNPDVANKIHSSNYASLHDLYADMYRINAEVQADYANSQDRRTYKSLLRLNSSSKDTFSSPPFNKTIDDIDNDEIEKQLDRVASEKKG